ncbi:MAG: S-methyl-5-thioribose-1-phosphate isomerase [Crenarchaeota archaeon]|nr:S-methyl-5-thioribose-1-phosphate isomerase [Thermoproteota archaeon]
MREPLPSIDKLKEIARPKVRPLIWCSENKILKVLDQRKLPFEEEYYNAATVEDIYKCIREMYVRGAPAIGICASYGMAIAAYDALKRGLDIEKTLEHLRRCGQYIASARPTAVNLEWAVKHMLNVAETLVSEGKVRNTRELAESLEREAINVQEEEFEIELKIGLNGLEKLRECSSVMTQCNAGGLAGAGIGTALAPMKVAKYLGMDIKVYVPETRPWLQGARLTVYELHVEGIPYVLIADTAVGYVMYRGMVEAVIVGADRILRDGHVINKIGTFKEAVIAHELGIPFYVAAPKTTFDMERKIEEVKIEERDPDEVRKIRGVLITLPDAPVYNPVFDITPPKYVTAIITEYGNIHPPYIKNIPRTLQQA